MENKGKSQILRIVRMLALLITCCAVFAAASFALEGIVDATVLNVRSETSVKSDAVGKLYNGDKVEITGRLGNWYSIKFKDERAFVFVDYVTFEKNYRVDVGYGMVKTASEYATVNLREQPSIESNRVTRLQNGTRVRILGYTDGWYYVRYVDLCGYISEDYLKLNGVIYSYAKDTDPNALDPEILEDLPNSGRSATLEETTSPKPDSGDSDPVENDPTPVENDPAPVENDPAPVENDPKPPVEKEPSEEPHSQSVSDIRNDIVEYAKSFLGTPYLFGGSSPKTGFDCSGLAQYVMNHFDIKISRSSAAQFGNGSKIAKSELLPGDLVFFSRSGYAVGHVGIYVGNNQFIHAPRTGDVVKISSLSENYYTARYVGARRVIED